MQLFGSKRESPQLLCHAKNSGSFDVESNSPSKSKDVEKEERISINSLDTAQSSLDRPLHYMGDLRLDHKLITEY
jgi:hypothetical protein